MFKTTAVWFLWAIHTLAFLRFTDQLCYTLFLILQLNRQLKYIYWYIAVPDKGFSVCWPVLLPRHTAQSKFSIHCYLSTSRVFFILGWEIIYHGLFFPLHCGRSLQNILDRQIQFK